MLTIIIAIDLKFILVILMATIKQGASTNVAFNCVVW
jgi:hypothetical protein